MKIKKLGIIYVFIAFLLVCFLSESAYPQVRCLMIKEYCYGKGYDAGKEEKKRGYRFNPDEYFNRPLTKIEFETIEAMFQREWLLLNDQEFDRCCRDGLLKGYQEGYHNKPKKESNYWFWGNDDESEAKNKNDKQ